MSISTTSYYDDSTVYVVTEPVYHGSGTQRIRAVFRSRTNAEAFVNDPDNCGNHPIEEHPVEDVPGIRE